MLSFHILNNQQYSNSTVHPVNKIGWMCTILLLHGTHYYYFYCYLYYFISIPTHDYYCHSSIIAIKKTINRKFLQRKFEF